MRPEEYMPYEACPKCGHAFISKHETNPQPRHVQIAALRDLNEKHCTAIESLDAQIAALKNDLAEIAAIIESVDMRAAATDGPVTPTLQEMTQAEISRIYAIAARRGRRGK